MRVLGINCTSRAIFFAIDDDSQIVDGLTERLQPPTGLEAGEALLELVESVRRVVREVRADRLALLLPEETWTASYSEHLDRAKLDILIRLAAAQERVLIEVLARPTLRARLELPRSGTLDSHVARVYAPVGRYWSAGRGLAALAAKAGELG